MIAGKILYHGGKVMKGIDGWIPIVLVFYGRFLPSEVTYMKRMITDVSKSPKVSWWGMTTWYYDSTGGYAGWSYLSETWTDAWSSGLNEPDAEALLKKLGTRLGKTPDAETM